MSRWHNSPAFANRKSHYALNTTGQNQLIRRSTMKTVVHRNMQRRLGTCVVLATTLLFGSPFARADVVLDWNAIAVGTAIQNGANPFAQARYAAIVQLAVFEAVNSITGNYRPYLGTIVAPAGALPDAAAVQAAHDVLLNYFQNSALALDNQLAASLALIPNGQAKTDGIATGKATAARNDRSSR